MSLLLSPLFLIACIMLLVGAFVLAFLYYWLKHTRYTSQVIPRLKKSVFLEIQVPKESNSDDQKPRGEEERKQLISVAEQLFTTLSHAGVRQGFLKANDHISFEIAAVDKKISFYINCSYDLKDLIEKQVHAQYPNAHIEEVRPYQIFKHGIL